MSELNWQLTTLKQVMRVMQRLEEVSLHEAIAYYERLLVEGMVASLND